MLKFNYLLAILASVLLLGSCSDNDDGNSYAQIVLYDNHFNVGSAVIWQGNPYSIANTVPYIWKDTYTNDNGETVTDENEMKDSFTEEHPDDDDDFGGTDDDDVFDDGIEDVDFSEESFDDDDE